MYAMIPPSAETITRKNSEEITVAKPIMLAQ